MTTICAVDPGKNGGIAWCRSGKWWRDYLKRERHHNSLAVRYERMVLLRGVTNKPTKKDIAKRLGVNVGRLHSLEERARRLRSLPESVNTVNSVNDIPWSSRVATMLTNRQIRTIGQLVSADASDLLLTRNFGRRGMEEIFFRLKEHGLYFGMRPRIPTSAGTAGYE